MDGRADEFLYYVMPYVYYVMPYVEGETLRQKLDRETQLGVEEAVKITTEVADALQYAHEHEVVHRDIKSENILLHAGRPMMAPPCWALSTSSTPPAAETRAPRLSLTSLAMASRDRAV